VKIDQVREVQIGQVEKPKSENRPNAREKNGIGFLSIVFAQTEKKTTWIFGNLLVWYFELPSR
jgi:hypothetical protein